VNGGDAAITPTETKVTVAVLAADLQYIKTKLDQVCNRHEAQDVRIDKLERLAWVLSGTGGLMAAQAMVGLGMSKRGVIVLLASLFLLVASALTIAQAPGPLLVNADFEQGFTQRDNAPEVYVAVGWDYAALPTDRWCPSPCKRPEFKGESSIGASSTAATLANAGLPPLPTRLALSTRA